MERNEQVIRRRSETTNSNKSKIVPVVLVILAVLGAAGLFVFLNNGSLKEKQLQLPSLTKDEIIVEKNFATGLRLAALGKYNEAVSSFDKLDFNKLTDSDKEIVLHVYLKAGQAQRALDLEPSFDETIINEYVKKGQLEKLRELKTDSKKIAFEIAVLDNDYEKIIDLKDEVKKDARRASAIANAYYQLGLKEEAVQFASLAVFDGINMWENKQQSHLSNEDSSQQVKTPSKESSGSFVSIVLLLIGMGLGAILFFIGQKTKKVVENKLSEKRERKKQKQKEKLDELNEENENSKTKEEEKTEQKQKNDKYSYYYEEED